MEDDIIQPTIYGPRTPGKKKVMVVPSAFFLNHRAFAGGPLVIEKDEIDHLLSYVNGPDAEFIDRDHAETDPNWLQVIPYVVIWRGRECFVYTRSPKGGENRLHGLKSVGVGGHIDEAPGGRQESYSEAFWRELDEEFTVISHPRSSLSNAIVGILYDPSNDVGKVHLGVVHYLRLPNGMKFELRDPALANGGFHHSTELGNEARSRPQDFESWSRAVLSRMM